MCVTVVDSNDSPTIVCPAAGEVTITEVHIQYVYDVLLPLYKLPPELVEQRLIGTRENNCVCFKTTSLLATGGGVLPIHCLYFTLAMKRHTLSKVSQLSTVHT